jgi:hypothetical protein
MTIKTSLISKIKIPMSQPVLTVIKERKLKELLPCKARFEASGVVAWKGHYYVVFDNFPQIARIQSDLTRDTPKESWINKKGKGPGFEDITYDQKKERFYAIVEALETKDKKFKGKIYEFDKEFSCLRKNWINVKFEDGNKGFEGLEHIRRRGKEYLLALCEGNKCRGGKKGKKPGGGRIKVLQKDGNTWVNACTIKLPKTLLFKDYASLTLQGNRLAIVSQKNSALWIGQLKSHSWTISGKGSTYQFPRMPQGLMPYGNVEGACWIGKNRLVVVSDKAKNQQDSICKTKDQSIHIVEIPLSLLLIYPD